VEDVNKRLLENFRICLMLLEHFSDLVADPYGWQKGCIGLRRP